jgi:site-specific DNA recombinase
VNQSSSLGDRSCSNTERDVTRCVMYTRVSTIGQADDGVSLELQKERLTAYATALGWTMIKHYEDAGYSGSTMNRPALNEMLTEAKKRSFERILVYKIDRIARNVAGFHALMTTLDDVGVALVSTTQSIDTSTPTGRLMRNILVDFAGFERDMIVERTRDAMARLREQGTLVSGVAPFGFQHFEKTLRIDTALLPVVKSIFQRAEEGEPERHIAANLGLTRDQVRSVLHNSLFAGKISYNRRGKSGSRKPFTEWQFVQFDDIDPLLTFEDWLALQQELHERSDRSEGHTLPLFGRLIYCVNCEHLLSAHGNAKGKRTKYACERARPGQKSCGVQLWEHWLLPVFLAKLSLELKAFSPRFDGVERLAEIDQRIAKCDRDIVQLEKRLAIPEVSVDRVRERILEIRDQRHQALQQRASVDEERARLDEVRSVLADFEPFFRSLNRQGQLEVIRKFVKRIDLGVTNIVIHWRFSETDCVVGRSEVSPKARKKGDGGRVVEIGGLEPPTSCMPCRRSPS